MPKSKRTLFISKISKRAWWIILAVVVLASAGGFTYYRLTNISEEQADDGELQTATVRSGDLVIYEAPDRIDIPFGAKPIKFCEEHGAKETGRTTFNDIPKDIKRVKLVFEVDNDGILLGELNYILNGKTVRKPFEIKMH